MSDKRWCDYCGKNNDRLIVHWYYTDELDEISLCNRHAKEIGLTRNDLIEM